MLNAFKNLNIKLKLLCGFGVTGLLLVVIGGMSIVGMNRLNANTEFIYKTNLVGVTVMSDLRAQMLRRSNLVVWHILANDAATMAEREKSIAELDKEIGDLLEKYVPLIVMEQEKKVFEQFKAGIPEYMEARRKVLQLSSNYSKDAAAEVQKTELAEKISALYEAVDWLVDENKRQAEESYQSGHDLRTSLNWGMSILNISAIFIGAFTVWFVSKVISKDLLNVLDAAHKLQGGQLTHRSSVTTQDEIGQLAKAFNQMADSLESASAKQEQALKVQAAELSGVTNAIGRAQACIEFNVDGTIITANENFLGCLGYSLQEITGQHHRMFCDPAYASSAEYPVFWQKLNRGEFDAGQYQLVGKGGKEIWIQASYNPILDANGKVYKVVEFATDITAQKRAQVEMEHLVADAQAVLGRLATNDLTEEMAGTYQGELDKIKLSINAVVHNLSCTIATVHETAESVLSGAEEITKGNEDLSQRTSEQASALEETSASMEEMTSTVKQNADNAKQANQLAASARDTADKGGAVTKRAVDAMGEINKSSKKIADIITVIDEIAFQTNLLALNAAVEAARAGEHGRGFAVVAAEVRNLAQRSATAAKEIKGLINESIQRVNDGSELVNQSGKTLEEIVGSVKRVTDIIAEITAASQEQASGIDQVNKAIMQMDETTQQNAALVEETTSASQSMKEQIKGLLQQIKVFKVKERGGESPVRHAAVMNRSLSDSVVRPSTASAVPKPSPIKREETKPLAGVSSGNGKDRRSTGDEFEEF
ncbi:MAG: MCP four helix bundle domain-containing protein [Nitrospira sp.]|nr:MCP four helix bundle domain-containing protein [Nitrospira sp.]